MKNIYTEFNKAEEIQNQLIKDVNKQIIDEIIMYGSSSNDKIIYKTHKTKPVDKQYIYSQLPDIPLVGYYTNPTLIIKDRYSCKTHPYGGVSIASYYIPFINIGVCW